MLPSYFPPWHGIGTGHQAQLQIPIQQVVSITTDQSQQTRPSTLYLS